MRRSMWTDRFVIGRLTEDDELEYLTQLDWSLGLKYWVRERINALHLTIEEATCIRGDDDSLYIFNL